MDQSQEEIARQKSQLPPEVDIPTTPSFELETISEIYEVEEDKVLGAGGFSKVCLAKHKESGETRAMKIMDRKALTGKKAKVVAHEKEILRRTRHPNIIHLHDCIATEEKMYMAMDLMPTDLFNYFHKRGALREKYASYIMYQLLSAIDYLHSNSIVHRDIKPENILIDPKTFDVKLADFGFAKMVMEWDIKNSPLGTVSYIAPEIIRGIESYGFVPLCTTRDEVKFIDIWAAGVTAYVICTARMPFRYPQTLYTRQERSSLMAQFRQGIQFPTHMSQLGQDFIVRCLALDGTSRMTAAQALRHPWLQPASEWYAKRFPKIAAEEPTAPTPGASSDDVITSSEPTPLTREDFDNMTNNLREDGDEQGDTTDYHSKVQAPKAAESHPQMHRAPPRHPHNAEAQ